MARAHTPEFRAELVSVTAAYARHGKTGEAKVAFSTNGASIIMEATDEKLLASADGGAHGSYLPSAKLIGMPTVSPDGRYAVVRVCTEGTCGAPPRKAKYEPALVTFNWISDSELVEIDRSKPPSAHGCGPQRVVSVK